MPLGGLRVLEALQAGLGQRVDADDLARRRLGLLQGGEHARVVGARVLPGDDDQVGLVEVLQGDAALADADGLGQRGARRLVAHVGAVRQVVGAELAGEELVEERGLVAGAARGVEEGLVGGAEGGELLGDDGEGALPGDGLVAVGALGQVHRVREPALLAQPVAGAVGQVGHGCAAKNSGVTRRRVASSATALAPFSQNSAVCRCVAARARRSPGSRSRPSG